MKVSWEDNTHTRIHHKCHYKSDHNDIKYHMSLNTTFIVVGVGLHQGPQPKKTP